MRLLDRLPAGIRRYVLLVDAVSRLGPAWLAFRLRYWFEGRLGVLVRRSPVGEWPSPVPDAPVPSIIDIDALRGWLVEHCDEERLARLRRHAENVAARRFDVFGQLVELDDWQDDARDGHHYDPEPHWSRVSVPEGADVKFVWEPSRFGWIFDLVRLHLIDPDAGADAIFWDAFDEWCEQNPPNRGINWACGQEASIRLMAVVIAASALRETATAEQMQKVQRLAWVTAARVEANIAYARSQRNNHHASEAVGLLTASLLFPGHANTDRWRKLGERHLQEVCETLVFEDGGTSQYSTNYHRVFVHNFVWALECSRRAGATPMPTLVDALARATRVMRALVDPRSGDAPFFGADDGARLLALADVPHRRLADDVAVCQASIGGDRASHGQEWESNAWFGLADSGLDPWHPEERAAVARRFPDFGILVGASGANRVVLTARRHRFRPGHDDGLHCDVWMRGEHRLPDAGTQSYHPMSGFSGLLDTADDHNGPRALGHPLMRKASRFLWARWTTTTLSSVECHASVVRLDCSARTGLAWVRRVVEIHADKVELTDSSNRTFATRILVEGEAPDISGGVVEDDARRISRGYGRAIEGHGKKIVATHSPIRIQLR